MGWTGTAFTGSKSALSSMGREKSASLSPGPSMSSKVETTTVPGRTLRLALGEVGPCEKAETPLGWDSPRPD